eukprot:scaffold22908_cov53-Cyclotella_meneghiniana.AAC.2
MADSNHLNLSGDHVFLPIDMTAYAARPAAITGQESSLPAAKMGVRCVQKSYYPLTIEDIYHINYTRNATV